MAMTRIAAPAKATIGEIIQLKVLIRHPMETGYRRDLYGKQIPRDILKRFECRYNGETVFAAELFPAVAADPFLTFYTGQQNLAHLNFVGPTRTAMSRPKRDNWTSNDSRRVDCPCSIFPTARDRRSTYYGQRRFSTRPCSVRFCVPDQRDLSTSGGRFRQSRLSLGRSGQGALC